MQCTWLLSLWFLFFIIHPVHSLRAECSFHTQPFGHTHKSKTHSRTYTRRKHPTHTCMHSHAHTYT